MKYLQWGSVETSNRSMRNFRHSMCNLTRWKTHWQSFDAHFSVYNCQPVWLKITMIFVFITEPKRDFQPTRQKSSNWEVSPCSRRCLQISNMRKCCKEPIFNTSLSFIRIICCVLIKLLMLPTRPCVSRKIFTAETSSCAIANRLMTF